MAIINADGTDHRVNRILKKQEYAHIKEILQLKQSHMLRVITLSLLGISGLSAISFAAYIAQTGATITLILSFLMSGVVLLAFGVTVAMTGISNRQDNFLKGISTKAFYEELDKK